MASSLGNILPAVASVGASLIPGVGPFVAPIVGSLASGMLSQNAAGGNQQNAQNLTGSAAGSVNTNNSAALNRFLSLARGLGQPPSMQGYGTGSTVTQPDYSQVLAQHG